MLIAQVGTVDTLAEILAIGNTTGATDIAVDSAQKVQFRDAAIYINSSVDGQLDIVADTEIQIAATTVDLNGNLDVSGTLGVTGVLTATSLDISGDIDVDGTTNLDVVDIDGAVDMASTLLVTGVLTTTAATVSNGGGQFNGAINVGVDDTGYDVKFFGATTGKSLLWDESADSLIVTGTTTLVGTTNLDAVDIDGATQIDATVTVGVDDTGYDVKFFGATAGAYMLWDESADDLILGGAAGLSVNSTALVTGVLTTTAATVHTGGITMPNNAKAIFGTGSSLEIYGTGTDSRLVDSGTGTFYIAGTDIVFVDGTLAERYADFTFGGAVTLYYDNAAKIATTATGIDVTGTVTATGTSVFASLDISGDIDVDGTTNLDVVDIDGAVDMASTLQVTGTANFSDRIGSTYVYPTDPDGQTGGVTNYFWKMGRMTLDGPAAAEIKLYGLQGYGQGDQIAGTNIIQLRGSNSATVLDGCFHAIGDPGIGIQEMRYVPIGSSVFDLYVKLGPYFSLSTTVVSGGAWVPEWTDTGSGSNPASSVDIPPQYALVLGSTLPMHANLTEVAFNDYSNDVDFRVESDNQTHMLFVDANVDRVGVGAAPMTNGSTFQVTSDSTESTNLQLTLRGASDTNKQMVMGFDTTANTAHVTTQIAGSAPTPLIFKTGNVVFNEASSDSDFRVKSDANTHAIYVDGANNSVTLGSSSSASNTIRTQSTAGFQASTDSNFETAKAYTFRDGVGIDNPNSSSFSTATAAVLCVGAMSTSRSINATGTVNASGADYAEYEANNGLVISKGSIVGFKADGTLTLTFSEAVRFGVKSTDPAYVGGDTWSDVEPPEKNTAAWDTWFAETEAKRAKVDRVAYSGKVPVNVQGATAGQYIIAVANSSGEITGQAVTDPDFSQYKLSVGRVNKILEDGRAELAVIIH
jgi:cytoskeletal protein CcmA (bactofilin family)